MWLIYLAWFFGGGFLANAIPHFVNGISGRAFQSPFAKPPGKGLSSPVVNVGWGMANAVAAWLLLTRVGAFNLTSPCDALAFGLGFLLCSLLLAHYFGRYYGGGLK